jgi:hypothetical protein
MHFCKMFSNGLEPPLAHVGPLTPWLVLRLARVFNNDGEVLLMLGAPKDNQAQKYQMLWKDFKKQQT